MKTDKYYSYKEKFVKLSLTTLPEKRIRSYRIKTFKIINGISFYGRHFQYFS